MTKLQIIQPLVSLDALANARVLQSGRIGLSMIAVCAVLLVSDLAVATENKASSTADKPYCSMPVGGYRENWTRSQLLNQSGGTLTLAGVSLQIPADTLDEFGQLLTLSIVHADHVNANHVSANHVSANHVSANTQEYQGQALEPLVELKPAGLSLSNAATLVLDIATLNIHVAKLDGEDNEAGNKGGNKEGNEVGDKGNDAVPPFWLAYPDAKGQLQWQLIRAVERNGEQLTLSLSRLGTVYQLKNGGF